jgi:hypothetical protein
MQTNANQKTKEETLALPTNITQFNERVAEVRLICDQCGTLIGISLMKKKQADAQKNGRVICQSCKEKNQLEKKKP